MKQKESKIECATCRKHFVWDEAYNCQDTPGSISYNPPGSGIWRPRVFCPHCGSLVAEWHITREEDFDEWKWFGDNASLNVNCSLPPNPLTLWGKNIPPEFLPAYEEHKLDVEGIRQAETKTEAQKETRTEIQGKAALDWKQLSNEAFRFFKEGDIKKALELLQRAVTAGLPSVDYAVALGVIGEHYLLNERDVDSALEYLTKSVETHFSGFFKVHLYLGLIYEGLGNNQKAKQKYLDAQRANPYKDLTDDYKQKVRQIVRSWVDKKTSRSLSN